RFDCDWSSDVCSSDLADQSGVTHGTEIIEAGSGDDTIEMSGPRVRLHGNAGSDELLVDGGPGAAFGGPGDDTLTVSGAAGRLREIGRASCRERVWAWG